MDPTQWGAPFPVVVAALFVIVLLRSNGTYWLGRLVAGGAQRTRVAHWMGTAGYRRAEDRINRWGAPAVSLSFLTIGVQTMVNLAAGATRMPLARYIPATVVGSTMWAFLYGTVGFVGFEALALLWQYSLTLALAAGAVAMAGFGWFIGWQIRRSRVDPRAAVAESGGADEQPAG